MLALVASRAYADIVAVLLRAVPVVQAREIGTLLASQPRDARPTVTSRDAVTGLVAGAAVVASVLAQIDRRLASFAGPFGATVAVHFGGGHVDVAQSVIVAVVGATVVFAVRAVVLHGAVTTLTASFNVLTRAAAAFHRTR